MPVDPAEYQHFFRRTHLSEGLKTKSWDERMRKKTEAAAVKKLERELKEEKQAEIQAWVLVLLPALVQFPLLKSVFLLVVWRRFEKDAKQRKSVNDWSL